MSDLMREEFEAWWSSTPILGENKRTIAEKAWQASRETMVIELPKEPGCPEDPEEAIDDSHMDAYHSAIRMRNACRDSIHEAGVKTK